MVLFRVRPGRLRLPFIDVDALIQATSEIFEYPMCDRDPLPWWTRGRVTLLGDAAHPMYPRGSTGSAQALIDCRTLADALASEADPCAALEKYAPPSAVSFWDLWSAITRTEQAGFSAAQVWTDPAGWFAVVHARAIQQ